MSTAAWVNGEPQDQVPVSNRGLQYGDGLFETLPIIHGQIPLLTYHLDRLYAGCERLAITAPLRDELQTELLNVARHERRAVLKLIVTRGAGGRGYQPPANAHTTRILTRHSWREYLPAWSESGVQLRICDMRLGRNSWLAGLKHLNRLEQVLARAEWSDGDLWQEGLMLDEGGVVIEGTMTNVFARLRDGSRVTPVLGRCGVAGVMRRYLLESTAQLGEPADEISLSQTKLREAQEVFICNSLIGVWPVRRIHDKEYTIGDWTRQMQGLARKADIGTD